MAVTVTSRTEAAFHDGGFSDSSRAVTIAVAAGDCLVCFTEAASGTAITISDGTNTYAEVTGSPQVASTDRVRCFVAKNVPANASLTITASLSVGTTGWMNLIVYRLAGADTTSPVSDSAGNAGSGTSISTASLTLSTSSGMILGFMVGESQGLAAGAGFTMTTLNGGVGNGLYFADEYQAVSGNLALSATCTSAAWAAVAVMIKAAAGGGGGGTPLTYDQWAALPSAQRVVLMDLTAGQQLRGWTFDSATAVYRIAYDPFSHPTTARPDRGLYRGLDAVWENGTPLTVRASLGLVQANAGSYFFDEPNQTLYVRTSGSVNPDSVASILAIFHVCVATEPMHFAGQRQYDAQLTGDNLPSLLTEQSDPLLGVSTYPSGSVSINNADNFWDTLAFQSFSGTTGWEFVNMPVTFRVGGESMAFSDYALLVSMQIAKPPASNPDLCTFQLRSISNATVTAFPQHTYNDAQALGLLGAGSDPSIIANNATLNGVYLPMGWGQLFSVPLQRLDIIGVTHFGYTICQAIDPLQAGAGVPMSVNVTGGRVRDRATSAITELTTAQIFALTNGQVGVDSSFNPDDYDFFADVQVLTGLTLELTAGPIVHRLLTASGIPDSQINTAGLAALDTARPQWIGLYAPGGADVTTFQSATDLINIVERSLAISIHATAAFTFDCAAWDPSFTLATTPIYDESDVLSFSIDDSVTQQLVSKVVVQYAEQIGLGTWSQVSASSTEAAVTLGSQNSLTIQTCLANQHDAVDVANLALMTNRQATQKYLMTVGARAANANPWDKIRPTLTRGPSRTAGSFDQILEITAMTKHLSDCTVDLVLGNQRGFGESAKTIAPDGTPDWGSASADQKRQYLYVTDDTLLRADVSDTSSFRPGVVV